MESNIIIATFKDGVTFTKTAKQWQWDRGMILKTMALMFNGEPHDR